jgi:hypothetical protein
MFNFIFWILIYIVHIHWKSKLKQWKSETSHPTVSNVILITCDLFTPRQSKQYNSTDPDSRCLITSNSLNTYKREGCSNLYSGPIRGGTSRIIWPGPQAKRMSTFQKILVMGSSSSTYCVNFKLDRNPKELLQEIIKLGLSGSVS